MHAVVQALGAITVAIGVIAIAAGLFTGSNGNTPAMVAGLWVGGPAILSGALLYTFGTMAGQLIAIRKNTERQLAIFDRLGKPKA